MDELEEWPDVRARASVVNVLACRGASLRELARAANNDPAVIIAAITYEGGHSGQDSTLPGDVVLVRLKRLVRALTRQRAQLVLT